MNEAITIIKNNFEGREVWRYEGVILERGETYVRLEAPFNRDDIDLGYVIFRRGDRFVEWFFSDRWYNIFEVHDVRDDRLKGWYCNITRPAKLERSRITADDLELDLFVHPDGRMLVLDREAFNALPLDGAERLAALDGLAALQAMVREGAAPFERHLFR
jgi:predicted RNA-binding protein associated with RNAse of E/G family